ncbi:MSF1-domain-containing protein [Clavulina sp. PMI_390]|nr:MSF1-domain-containing protein [Clavulina sp. PMI_390]
MVYFLDQNHTYEHPWSLVNQGIWRKYPNRQCAHVISVDVLDRSVDPKTGIIRTERILGVKQKAPAWVLKLLGGSEDAFVREVSFVDPRTQRTTLTSVNLSLSQYLAVVENISYTPSSSAPLARTNFYQSVSIKAGSAMWRSLGGNLERWSAQRFFENASKGRQGLEEVLTRLWEELQHERQAAVMA